MPHCVVGVIGSVLVVASIVVVPLGVSGNTFCNMDETGGEKGRGAQRKSASAAAMFFDGAATAFQMFANLERHLAGDKDALKRAQALSRKSVEELSKSEGVSRGRGRKGGD